MGKNCSKSCGGQPSNFEEEASSEELSSYEWSADTTPEEASSEPPNVDNLGDLARQIMNARLLNDAQLRGLAFRVAAGDGRMDTLNHLLAIDAKAEHKISAKDWGHAFKNACFKGHQQIADFLKEQNQHSQDGNRISESFYNSHYVTRLLQQEKGKSTQIEL